MSASLSVGVAQLQEDLSVPVGEERRALERLASSVLAERLTRWRQSCGLTGIGSGLFPRSREATLEPAKQVSSFPVPVRIPARSCSGPACQPGPKERGRNWPRPLQASGQWPAQLPQLWACRPSLQPRNGGTWCLCQARAGPAGSQRDVPPACRLLERKVGKGRGTPDRSTSTSKCRRDGLAGCLQRRANGRSRGCEVPRECCGGSQRPRC